VWCKDSFRIYAPQRPPNATPRLLCGSRESQEKYGNRAIETTVCFWPCCLQFWPTLVSDVFLYPNPGELAIYNVVLF
jgi:hypothetical protein